MVSNVHIHIHALWSVEFENSKFLIITIFSKIKRNFYLKMLIQIMEKITQMTSPSLRAPCHLAADTEQILNTNDRNAIIQTNFTPTSVSNYPAD